VKRWVLVLAFCTAGCGKDIKDAPRPQPSPADPKASAPAPDAAPTVKADSYPDLGTALKAIIPADARVIGFGEMHNRTDRAQVKSALARFTSDGLPGLSDKLSDLIVETWIPDPKCGQQATTATAKVTITSRRPQETKSEIAVLAETARAAKVQPHAMKLKCEDYEKIAPAGKDANTEVMLDLITSELGRITDEAVAYRTKHNEPRPWIAIYGGGLHNERFPSDAVKHWSFAERVDKTTGNKYVEIDLIVPELAEGEASMAKEPWFPLVKNAEPTVKVWQRGERSFVVVFPRTK
jgi:hypothetical protein